MHPLQCDQQRESPFGRHPKNTTSSQPCVFKLIHAMIIVTGSPFKWFLRNVTRFTLAPFIMGNVETVSRNSDYCSSEWEERVNCTWMGMSRGGNLFWMGRWTYFHWRIKAENLKCAFFVLDRCFVVGCVFVSSSLPFSCSWSTQKTNKIFIMNF